MKNCTLCGKEYPDDYDYCPDDGTRLRLPQATGQGYPSSRDISTAEKAFWEKVTFRQLGVVMIRIQSIWLFFSAAYNLTYFVTYTRRNPIFPPISVGSVGMGIDLLMAAARVIVPLACAIYLITNTESVLSWFVKDMVQKEPDAGGSGAPQTPGIQGGGA